MLKPLLRKSFHRSRGCALKSANAEKCKARYGILLPAGLLFNM